MFKRKTLKIDNRLLLIIGSVAILLIIALWSVFANVYKPQLHGGPVTSVSGLYKLQDIPREGPRFVPPNEPVENVIDSKVNSPIKKVNTIETVKFR